MRSQLLDRFDRKTLPYTTARFWFAADAKVEHVQDSESFVYRVSVADVHFYLRFTYEVRRSREQITAELDSLLYLGKQGVPVASPVESRSGSLIETFSFDGLEIYACVFEAASAGRLVWRSAN
jgi:Ser/Thr protein kinase RdoA (MazF antagonist)